MFSFNAAVTAIWSSPTYAGSVPRDNKFHVYTLADTHTHTCMHAMEFIIIRRGMAGAMAG